MDQAAHNLQQRILALMAHGMTRATTDEEFDRLAREVFAFQYQRCAPYRAYCDRVKWTPQNVAHWKQIPAVPTSAFKDFALTCFPGRGSGRGISHERDDAGEGRETLFADAGIV